MSALYLIARHDQPDILDVQESTPNVVGPSVSGRFVVKVPDGIPIDTPSDLGDLLTQKAQGFMLVYAGFTQVVADDLLDTPVADFVNSFGITAGNRATITIQPGGIFQSLPFALGPFGTAAAVITVVGTTSTVTGLSGIPALAVGSTITFTNATHPGNNGTFTILTVSPDGTSVQLNNPGAVAGDYGVGGTPSSPTIAWVLAGPLQVLVTWDTYMFVGVDNATTLYSRKYEELANDPTTVLCQVSFNGGTTFTPALDSMILTLNPLNVGSSFIIQLTNTSTTPISIGSWTLIY
jgi:hypothetical protein